jgi:hypothetical protein
MAAPTVAGCAALTPAAAKIETSNVVAMAILKRLILNLIIITLLRLAGHAFHARGYHPGIAAR